MKFFQNSQRERIRTSDLAAPNGALYQLSYTLKVMQWAFTTFSGSTPVTFSSFVGATPT